MTHREVAALDSRILPTASRDSTSRRLHYEPLTPDDARTLFERALEALATSGVSVAGERAFDLLEGAGATIDRAAGVARLPATLVRGALDRAPATFTLAGRLPGHDVILGSDAALLAAGAAAGTVLDLETGDRRPATARDVIDACRLADALPEVAAVWAPPAGADAGAPARGCPPALEPCLVGTSKHVVLADLADTAVAMAVCEAAALVAGGAAEARERPPFSTLQSRSWGGEGFAASIDAALECATAGLPVGFTLPLVGEAAATDVTAAVTAVTAAILAACTLVQCAAPRAPFIAPALPGVLEALAPGCGRGPAATLVALGVSQTLAVAHLPLATGLPAAAAVEPTWESAVDNLFAGLTASLSRCGLVCGAGLLDGDAVYSPLQLLLDVETWSNTAAIGAGIVVDDETLALETIAAIGIGGNALGQKHTRRHMKDVWRTRLFDRAPYDAWDRDGRRDATDYAGEAARRTLATHESAPVDAETVATLRRIIEKAGL